MTEMREKIARACSIPQHHTTWDTLTWQEKDLFYMQADYVIALIEPVMEENEGLKHDLDRYMKIANAECNEAERFKNALNFYASENNWRSCTVYMCGHGAINCNAMVDKGNKARAALSPKSEKQDG
jgi:hypothetical protein